MAAAARLAARARPLSRPNPGVAALVVADGRMIARGWTQAGGRPHAEAAALAGSLAAEALLALGRPILIEGHEFHIGASILKPLLHLNNLISLAISNGGGKC
jgi:diaminohydroxyphosphoribosylaminopyrimidine deaminase/5-amino-6-(5-phosphoribosylamino)uracil reductase